MHRWDDIAQFLQNSCIVNASSMTLRIVPGDRDEGMAEPSMSRPGSAGIRSYVQRDPCKLGSNHKGNKVLDVRTIGVCAP